MKNIDFLTKTRRIFIWGEIDEKLSLRVVRQLLYLSDLNNDPITLYINSCGGLADEGLAIIQQVLILKENIEIRAIAYTAMSCAGDLLALCTKGQRFVTHHTVAMYHPTSYSNTSMENVEKHKNLAIFQEKQNSDIDRIVAKACGKKYETFKKDIESGLYLLGDEIIKYKAADKIL